MSCLSECISKALGLGEFRREVPEFGEKEGTKEWLSRVNAWLLAKKQLILFPVNSDAGSRPLGRSIAVVKSDKGDHFHAVLCSDGLIEYDPLHPTSFIVGKIPPADVVYWLLFVCPYPHLC